MDLVSFLGPLGTFSHEVASKISDNLVPLCTIPAVMESVSQNECKYGVVPIENSIEGPVGITLDLFAHKYDLNIYREFVIPINHNLLINKEADMSQITDVYSHSQAISQCQDFISQNKFIEHFTVSTANACEFIRGKNNCAAIGSSKACEIYDLKIAESKIQDRKNNQTRFIVLASTDYRPTGYDKTSILFSFGDDCPGQLYEVLGIFNKNSINLTKIESRPTKEGLGTYFFFIDFEGHRSDENVSKVLAEIKNFTQTFKILGSYPNYLSKHLN